MYTFLGNSTYLKSINGNSQTASGIIIPHFVLNPRGACCTGIVAGIGEKESPVKAMYEVGDKVIFQKMAVTGFPFPAIADFKISNIDISAKLIEDSIVPVDTYVLCEFIRGEFIQNGVILNHDFSEYRNFATVLKVSSKCRTLIPGDEVVLDLSCGSVVMADEKLRISEDSMVGLRPYLLYREEHILARKIK